MDKGKRQVGPSRAAADGSLVRRKGSPYSKRCHNGGMLARSIRYSLVGAAALLAIYGVVSALFATPDPGVGITSNGASVAAVLPGSPAWRDGIRTGDMVVSLRDASSPEGWDLVAQGTGGTHGSSASSHLARLRGAVPVGLAGAAALLVACVALLRGARLGSAAIPLAVAVALTPLMLTGNMRDLIIGGLGSLLVAGAAIIGLAPGRLPIRLMTLASLALATAWVVAVVAAPAIFDPLDAARLPAVAAWTIVGGWLTIDRRRLARRLASPIGPNALDIVYLPTVAAVAIVSIAFLDVPLVAVAGAVVVLLALYPSARRSTSRAMERLLIGDVRRQAELRAVESERGRLAREIHDAPLQGLAAVIRRLDARPDAPAETAALREVAAQLRDVATALRPPVLEDLGLVAALEDLGDVSGTSHPDWWVTVQVDDLAVTGSHLDPEVETAAFRIVQEACSNALRHSRGRSLQVLGSVAADAVDLSVVDDGGGIDPSVVADARRRGHFGLDSMRDRAEAVGGSLDLGSDDDGFRVRFQWESRM